MMALRFLRREKSFPSECAICFCREVEWKGEAARGVCGPKCQPDQALGLPRSFSNVLGAATWARLCIAFLVLHRWERGFHCTTRRCVVVLSEKILDLGRRCRGRRACAATAIHTFARPCPTYRRSPSACVACVHPCVTLPYGFPCNVTQFMTTSVGLSMPGPLLSTAKFALFLNTFSRAG